MCPDFFILFCFRLLLVTSCYMEKESKPSLFPIRGWACRIRLQFWLSSIHYVYSSTHLTLLQGKWKQITSLVCKCHQIRLVEVERYLWRLSGPAPCSSRSIYSQVVQDHVQTNFECLQGGRLALGRSAGNYKHYNCSADVNLRPVP